LFVLLIVCFVVGVVVEFVSLFVIVDFYVVVCCGLLLFIVFCCVKFLWFWKLWHRFVIILCDYHDNLSMAIWLYFLCCRLKSCFCHLSNGKLFCLFVFWHAYIFFAFVFVSRNQNKIYKV